MKKLSELEFNNRFVDQLQVDPIDENYPRQVHGSFYSKVTPKKTAAPKLVCASSEVAQLLELDIEEIQSDIFLQVFSGNQLIPGMFSQANLYGGHQFGNWAGQLGDGRAINLGDVKNSKGQHWALQLKGAGPTPYSRTADGLAVLRSSIREFLCSEAMHHLGVPTTRALSLITTGDLVRRDMFYNGNPQLEQGAVVCRVVQSFIRFGHFEIFAARKELDHLRQLVDFCIRNDFPELLSAQQNSADISVEVCGQWFHEICRRTAILMAHWMRVGFVHGVMNTDNMSILGLTIDYGPYGWLEPFDPDWTPNTTDAQFHRYAFGKQPEIAQWNLTQLANALYPIIPDIDLLRTGIQIYQTTYANAFRESYNEKLGLSKEGLLNTEWLSQLFELLENSDCDMTIFFRSLAQQDWISELKTQSELVTDFEKILESASYQLSVSAQLDTWRDWFSAYQTHLKNDFVKTGELFVERQTRMNRANPLYVFRNYLAQQAIDKAEQGDFSEVQRLYELFKSPYEAKPGFESYTSKRPDWAVNKPGCSMLSCSS